MTRRQWLISFIVMCIVLGGYALRLWHLGTESIWHDEAWSIRAFRGPFTTPDDNTPYLYYVSGHALWRLGGGESALALRYISVLFGTLTVALTLRLGRRWLGIGGMLAVGLGVAINPLLWEYAQEVRAYVVVPLIALGLLAVADAILKHKAGHNVPRVLWGLAFAVQVIGLYTHNLSVPLILWLNVAVGVAWLLRRDWRKMVVWAGVAIAVIAAYIPWLLTQSPSGTPLNTPPQLGLALVADIWASYFFPVQQQLQDVKARLDGFDVWTPTLIFGALIVGLWLVWVVRGRDERRQGWLLTSHVLLVPLFSTLLMIVAQIDFHPRYYIAAVPGTLLLIVMVFGRRQMIVVMLLLALTAVSLFQIRTRSNYQHDDFRGLAQYYATLPEDAVILVPFNVERALQDYYAQQLPIRAQFINVPLYSDEATVTVAINALIEADTPRHVEFLTWYQLPADVRGMYPCLLMAASDQVDDPRDYFGLSTQAYTLTQPITMMPLGGSSPLRGLSFDGAAAAASTQGTCLRTDWTLTAPTDEDYQVAVALLNPISQEIDRADALMARADNAPTSDWQVSAQGAAYALLNLPPGAPTGDYSASVGAYSAAQPEGVDVLDLGGGAAGKSMLFFNDIPAQGQPLALFDETTLMEESARTLRPGDFLSLTLFLVPQADATSVTVRLGELVEQVSVDAEGALFWQRYFIPHQFDDETLTLTVDDQPLATYTITPIERIYETPAFNTPVDVAFPSVGVLLGADVPATVTADEPPQVTLIWRAMASPEINYTAFVQMLSPDGRVIAQSDQMPERRTVGWLADEYIIDTHMLRFNEPAYTGDVRIVAGLYEAHPGFPRVMTDAGTDAATIADAVPVR
jgi:hypothetical protein